MYECKPQARRVGQLCWTMQWEPSAIHVQFISLRKPLTPLLPIVGATDIACISLSEGRFCCEAKERLLKLLFHKQHRHASKQAVNVIISLVIMTWTAAYDLIKFWVCGAAEPGEGWTGMWYIWLNRNSADEFLCSCFAQDSMLFCSKPEYCDTIFSSHSTPEDVSMINSLSATQTWKYELING